MTGDEYNRAWEMGREQGRREAADTIERLRAENERLSNIMRNAIKAFDIAKGALSALEPKPVTCTHDIIEKDNACADGMCPICLAAEVERLRKRIAEFEAADERFEAKAW